MATINTQYQDSENKWITKVDLDGNSNIFFYSATQPTEEQIDAALNGVVDLTNYATKSEAIAFAIAL